VRTTSRPGLIGRLTALSVAGALLFGGCAAATPTAAPTAAPTTAATATPATTAATAAPTTAPTAAPTAAPTEAPTPEPTAAAEVEIRIWDPHGPNFAAIAQTAITDYKALHPNVTVKIEPVDNSVYLQRILTAAAADTLPDIIYAGPGIIQSMLKAGTVFGPMPVEKFQDHLSHMVPAFVKLQQDAAGTQVLLPMGGGYHGWEYRVDAFAEAGITEFPKTWSAFSDACKKLVVKDAAGKITREGISWRFRSYGLRVEFQIFLASQGSALFDANGKAQIDTPEGLKVLQFMHDTVYKDQCSLPLSQKQVPPVGVLPAALGTAAIDLQFPGSETFAINYAKEHPEYSDKWNKSPLWPAADGPDGKNVVLISGDGYGVAKSSKNAETAWDFIAFLGQPKYMLQLATFSTVARVDVMSDQSVKDFYAQAPNAKNVLDLFTNPDVMAMAVPDYTDPHLPAIELIFADALTAMFEDPNADLPAILKDIQAKVDEAMTK
jgi:multiple sugar transport system substrate-binding protein